MTTYRIELSRLDSRKGIHRYLSNLPEFLTCCRNIDLLHSTGIGLFCSRQCPGNIILRLLLRGKAGVILCHARSIESLRIPSRLKPALEEGRILLLSPFSSKERRITRKLAERRNEFVAALADAILLAHAAPGSKTKSFAQRITAWEKPLYTIEIPSNRNLIEQGQKKTLHLPPGKKIKSKFKIPSCHFKFVGWALFSFILDILSHAIYV